MPEDLTDGDPTMAAILTPQYVLPPISRHGGHRMQITPEPSED